MLDGITRNFIIQKVLPELKLTHRELKIFPKDLSNYSECFLSASIKGVTGIYQIDQHNFQSCVANSFTKKIHNSYNKLKCM